MKKEQFKLKGIMNKVGYFTDKMLKNVYVYQPSIHEESSTKKYLIDAENQRRQHRKTGVSTVNVGS